ncbi:MAG: hypothetical protein A2Z88_06845 [Omnitrophica WOR_2 bacterium GWA2_47_8]|nr:MAG: hypothetical protein A2Z88_06845 [Omnitrophica WOR_2 bacterium GWA2_47_8]
MVQIVIVAGGLATRMGSLTEQVPKCLIDIHGTPLIEHQLMFFKKKGFTEFIFCVAHLAHKVKEHFGDGSRLGLRILYAEEKKGLLGTAGSVKQASHLIRGERFIVYYGDNLTALDVDKLLLFHDSKKSEATLCVRPLPEGYKSSSLVILDKDRHITHFAEKPEMETIATFKGDRYINSGIYVLERKVLDLIPPDVPHDFSSQLFPRMMEKGYKLHGYVMDEFFREVGRVRKYEGLLDELKDVPRIRSGPGEFLG